MRAIWLLLLPGLAFAAEKPEVKTCAAIVQAVDWSRWVGNYAIEQTIQSFEDWSKQADQETSSMRFPWYVPAVLTLIQSGYKAEDRDQWRNDAMRACLSIAGGKV